MEGALHSRHVAAQALPGNCRWNPLEHFGMATAEQYAASIVEKYHVVPDPKSASHRAVDKLGPILKAWGNQYLSGITLSGAYAKNTAITLASHVDVLVLLNPVPNRDIRTVFWNLFEYITDQGFKAHTREVTIQVPCEGLNVDLIPAYRDGSNSAEVLFSKKADAAIHTNVGQHVHLVSNSGRQQEICALKIWRERNRLEFPSFYLELVALEALENERFGQLADNVLAVLRYLASRFEKAVVRDPANRSNVVSSSLADSAKRAIAKAARDVLYDENWKKILW
jgi:hypothetical protein